MARAKFNFKNKNYKIIRPKSKAYIIYNLIKFLVFAGLICLFALGLSAEKPFSTGEIDKIVQFSFVVLVMMFILMLIVLQMCELISYKIIIGDDFLTVSTERDFLLLRQKDVKVNYSGIKELQYKKMLRPELIFNGMMFFSAIYITREGCKKEEYISTVWFSENQIKSIMQNISVNAEKTNNFPCLILPDDIK